MFQTKEKTDTAKSYILELETVTNRDDLVRVLGDKDINIQFNGGFYTITSASSSAQEMLNKLVNSKVSITYFRDITYSTKRFFN